MFGVGSLPRSLDAALRDAQHGKLPVRLSAVHELGRHAEEIRGGEALSVLLAVLAADPAPEVRAAAAVALADARAHMAIAALARAFTDDVLPVRQMALLALGEVGNAEDDRVTSLVEGAYRDAEPALRFQAIIAGNALSLRSAEAALAHAVDDVDAEVRQVALRLFEERATSDDDGPRLTDVARAAARKALADSKLGVRVAAAILLAGAGERDGALVESVLVEAIAAGDGAGALAPEDEQAAIVLAGELELEAARPVLAARLGRRLFGRDRFLFDVRIALARLKDPRASREILDSLRAWSRDVRTLGVVAAGRARLGAAHESLLSMRGDPRRAEPEAVEEALAMLENPAPGALPEHS